jgi:hypothetical protein
MVVAVGLTVVEPLAEVDVNVPGEMAMLTAPVVLHARVLLPPDSMLAGLAVKEVIFGLVMVTVALAVDEPEELAAVSV